jgi:hypothetical protein
MIGNGAMDLKQFLSQNNGMSSAREVEKVVGQCQVNHAIDETPITAGTSGFSDTVQISMIPKAGFIVWE